MEKYYTPVIEEFHVGFEFHENGKAMICVDPVREIYEGFIEKRLIVVKYLDREDVESLGWKEVQNKAMAENDGYELQLPFPYLERLFYKIFVWPGHTLRIRIEDPLCGPVFDGLCKNKSELKRVMSQLEIAIKK